MYLCGDTICVCDCVCVSVCVSSCVCVNIYISIYAYTQANIYIYMLRMLQWNEGVRMSGAAVSNDTCTNTCLSLKCLLSSIKSHLTLQSLERELIDTATIYGPVVCSSLYLSFTASPLFKRPSTHTHIYWSVRTNEYIRSLFSHFKSLSHFFFPSSRPWHHVTCHCICKYKGMKVYK